MNLNIDALGFIVALRASLEDQTTEPLKKVYLALKSAPGHRPLTAEEMVGETARAYQLLTERGQFKPDWATLAGSL